MQAQESDRQGAKVCTGGLHVETGEGACGCAGDARRNRCFFYVFFIRSMHVDSLGERCVKGRDKCDEDPKVVEAWRESTGG